MLSVWRQTTSWQLQTGSMKTLSHFCRSLSFVAKPPSPGRGLKKDPEEYMVSPSGVRYPGNADTLAPVKNLLGEEFKLSENLLRQCMVHKSFAHGKVPYNEKLAILGQKLLRLQSFRAAIESSSDSESGKNFNMSPNAVEILTSTPVLSIVCDRAGLEPSMFYKPAGDQVAPTVKAKALQSIVGALILEQDASTAIKFINTRLLDGELNVFSIADSLYVHK